LLYDVYDRIYIKRYYSVCKNGFHLMSYTPIHITTITYTAQRHQQSLERSRCVGFQIVFQRVSVFCKTIWIILRRPTALCEIRAKVDYNNIIITFFVDRGNGPDSEIAERAQNFGNSLFVGAHATDGVLQFLGVKLRKRGHQSDDGVLEVPTEFALQIVD